MVKLEDGRVVHMLAFQPGRKYTVDGEQIEGEVMIYPVLEKQLARYPFSGILATFHERIADAMMVVIVGF